LVLLALFSLVVPAAHAKRPRKEKKKDTRMWVVLDGRKTRVVWNDGDSFRVIRGPHNEMRARLDGYNTLESYGPVHFWGPHHGYDLYDNGKEATELAKSKVWECQTKEGGGGYGRTLVVCPELREEMLAKGLAHLFAVVGKPDPKLVAIQLDAQKNRRGMWKRTIPSTIVTSIHSITEKEGEKDAEVYNRVCDTRTGMSWKVKHKAVFKPCDAFCHGGSCMIYVPFELRYGDKKPQCMTRGRDNRLVLPGHLGDPMGKR
jgi:endonuclease YncB( thermonuclease family)